MDSLDANLEALRRAVERPVNKSSRSAEVPAGNKPDAIDQAVEWQPTGWLARLFGGRS